MMKPRMMLEGQSFNSLQTGRHIQSEIQSFFSCYCYCYEFQFPSNGKAYPKTNPIGQWLGITTDGFNSLQTGRHIQRSLNAQTATTTMNSFNSLQTGRHIQSPTERAKLGRRCARVSIPFKREGISKVGEVSDVVNSEIVSIPFKREGISKESQPSKQGSRGSKFQFPSNGKAYPKPATQKCDRLSRASSFNSLQTGRHIQSLREDGGTLFDLIRRVSIPFKREGISKAKQQPSVSFKTKTNVSIPFKREGISKGTDSKRRVRTRLSFNSLQTGRHIQRHRDQTGRTGFRVSIPFKREGISKVAHIHLAMTSEKFQFPSNGKAYPKRITTNGSEDIGSVSIPFKREGISKVGY